MERAKEAFYAAADWAGEALASGETFTMGFVGEASDFVRFSRGRVRQAGRVRQLEIALRLIAGARHASASLTLTGARDEDRTRVIAAVARLRERAAVAPEDPYLLLPETVNSSERDAHGTALPDPAEAVYSLIARDDGDRVGIYAAGSVARGFASSSGQRNWFSTPSFHLDWSHVDAAGRAAKATYAGTEWNPSELARHDAQARTQLAALARPARALSPGTYRAFLSPAAIDELLSLLSWDAFGEQSRRTKMTPWMPLIEGRASLSPALTLCEHVAGGMAPGFSLDGFARPDRIPLITRGRDAGSLVSPRSAREFGVATNGASAGESPDSLEIDAGDLPTADVLGRLGTGVWISNLWYLNYSDRPAGRITGMTRFATLWVEHGEIVGPVDPMRFDESLYQLFGAGLEAFTHERAFLPSSDTYFQRSTASTRVPGALVHGLAFTL